jgi:hypothetical protein
MKILLTILLIAVTAIAADAQTRVRQRDIEKAHVTIQGITVGVTGMAAIRKSLGPNGAFKYSVSGREVLALCYSSGEGGDAAKLLFVSDTADAGGKVVQVRVTAGDVAVKYGRRCLASKAIGKEAATESGLKLGMTSAEVRSVLGEPTDKSAGFLGYEFHLHRALTEKEVRRIEVEWPTVRQYPYYDISASVEARFVGGLLKRLDLIRFSTY